MDPKMNHNIDQCEVIENLIITFMKISHFRIFFLRNQGWTKKVFCVVSLNFYVDQLSSFREENLF